MVKSNLELDKAVAARNLGQLILKYRTINDLSQTALGKKLWKKVSHASVSRWEKGKQLPDRDNLKGLARILEKSPDELNSLIEDPQLDLDKVDVPDLKLLTPNKDHLRLLKQGVKVWNRWRKKYPLIIPQLAGLDLRRWTLDGIDLSRADLRKARIRASSIKKANFERANLSSAYFDTVCLNNSSFNDANLSQCVLRCCSLNDVWLKRVDFTRSNIDQSKFHCSCLYQSRFDFAQLHSVDFRNANLNQTSWHQTSAKHLKIFGASFEGVNFEQVSEEENNIDPKGYGIPIKNLASASLVYMDRYHRPVLERYLEERKLELKVEAIVYELLRKYGSKPEQRSPNACMETIEAANKKAFMGIWLLERNPNAFFCSCIIADPYHLNEEGEEILLKYIIEQSKSFISVGYIIENGTPIPLDSQSKNTRYDRNNGKTILLIEDQVVSCNVHPQDLEDLKTMLAIITQQQTKRVKPLIQTAKEIFRALLETCYQDREYTLFRHEDNLVLKHSNDSGDLIMDINLTDDLLTIKRSVLQTRHLLHFQKALDKLRRTNNV